MEAIETIPKILIYEMVDNKPVYYIELNPRIQVEHTFTEEITGIDIVRCRKNNHSGTRFKLGNHILEKRF